MRIVSTFILLLLLVKSVLANTNTLECVLCEHMQKVSSAAKKYLQTIKPNDGEVLSDMRILSMELKYDAFYKQKYKQKTMRCVWCVNFTDSIEPLRLGGGISIYLDAKTLAFVRAIRSK